MEGEWARRSVLAIRGPRRSLESGIFFPALHQVEIGSLDGGHGGRFHPPRAFVALCNLPAYSFLSFLYPSLSISLYFPLFRGGRSSRGLSSGFDRPPTASSAFPLLSSAFLFSSLFFSLIGLLFYMPDPCLLAFDTVWHALNWLVWRTLLKRASHLQGEKE